MQATSNTLRAMLWLGLFMLGVLLLPGAWAANG